MRERDLKATGKYYRRMMREFARQSVGEVFEFFKEGVPDGWYGERSEDVTEVKVAFKDILESTHAGRQPTGRSLEVLQKYLNLPISVHCELAGSFAWKGGRKRLVEYTFGSRTQPLPSGHPSSRSWPAAREAAQKEALRGERYLWKVAGLLMRCLTEFNREVFARSPQESLIDLCTNCRAPFFKKKSNQVCCSRRCTNQYDYKRRTATEDGKQYYRDKSSRSYHSPGARRKSKLKKA